MTKKNQWQNKHQIRNTDARTKKTCNRGIALQRSCSNFRPTQRARNFREWFCIKSWQTLANLLLLCKAPSKKRLSERCRKHSNEPSHLNLHCLLIWFLNFTFICICNTGCVREIKDGRIHITSSGLKGSMWMVDGPWLFEHITNPLG